jgi:hypothetical protein
MVTEYSGTKKRDINQLTATDVLSDTCPKHEELLEQGSKVKLPSMTYMPSSTILLAEFMVSIRSLVIVK